MSSDRPLLIALVVGVFLILALLAYQQLQAGRGPQTVTVSAGPDAVTVQCELRALCFTHPGSPPQCYGLDANKPDEAKYLALCQH